MSEAQARVQHYDMRRRDPRLCSASSRTPPGTRRQRVVLASSLGASSSSLDSSDFSIGLITRVDDGKEARVEEAHV